MVLGCGAKVLKYCLFAFNLIFFIAGIVCLGIGIWLLADKNALMRIADEASDELSDLASKPLAIRHIGVMLSVGGAIVLFIAFLGCCGAVKEWRPLLIFYAICLMIILAVEIAAAIYAAINQNELEGDVKKFLKKSLEEYKWNNVSQDSAMKVAWDSAMKDYECCGVTSIEAEFVKSSWQGSEATSFPPACCAAQTTPCTADAKYKEGCFMTMKDFLESKLAVVIGIAAAVASIQVIGVIFALCLCKVISEQDVV